MLAWYLWLYSSVRFRRDGHQCTLTPMPCHTRPRAMALEWNVQRWRCWVEYATATPESPRDCYAMRYSAMDRALPWETDRLLRCSRSRGSHHLADDLSVSSALDVEATGCPRRAGLSRYPLVARLMLDARVVSRTPLLTLLVDVWKKGTPSFQII